MLLCSAHMQPWGGHLGTRKSLLRLRIQRDRRKVLQQGSRCIGSAATAAAALPLCGAGCSFALQPRSSAVGCSPVPCERCHASGKDCRAFWECSADTHTYGWPHHAKRHSRCAQQLVEGGRTGGKARWGPGAGVSGGAGRRHESGSKGICAGVRLQLQRLALGVRHHLGREPGKLRDMDAEGLVAGPRRHLRDPLAPPLLLATCSRVQSRPCTVTGMFHVYVVVFPR